MRRTTRAPRSGGTAGMPPPPTSALLPGALAMLAALVVLAGLWAAPAAAESEPAEAELARAIEHRVAELHALMAERREAAREDDRQLERLGEQIARLEADLAETTDAERERAEAVDALEAEVAALERERDTVSEHLAAAADAATPAAERMRPRVAAGIPFRRGQRTAAIDHALTTMTDADAEAAERAAGVVGLWSLTGDDLRLAGSVDFWNDAVDLPDGRRQHAYVARLGLVQQLFLSEDGRTLGLAAMDDHAAWRTELTDAERRQVRHAIAILQQHKPPQILPIPLAAPRDGGD